MLIKEYFKVKTPICNFIASTIELSCKNIKRIETSHYSRIKDFKKTISRECITSITKRMPPKTWMKYYATKLAIKIIRDAAPTNLHQKK